MCMLALLCIKQIFPVSTKNVIDDAAQTDNECRTTKRTRR